MIPYAIDALPVARGHVGLCCCPGHRLTPRFVWPCLEDFEADLDAIAAFGAKRLVTLMEPGELRTIGIDSARLEREAAARGFAWMHLPIRNLSTPSSGWEANWTAAGDALRQELAAGGRFVMHCYAGLGRTGTIAARLLVEHGAMPPDAIAAVRTVRPGSLETAEQEAYVLRQAWRPGFGVRAMPHSDQLP
jgi:ADP-ribosyl-[dinitrogen reductase] hydrolase